MEHEHPLTKAMREFALADPDDCDREWAAYLALLQPKVASSATATTPAVPASSTPTPVAVSSTATSTRIPTSAITRAASTSCDINLAVTPPTNCSTVCLGGNTQATSAVSTPAASLALSSSGDVSVATPTRCSTIGPNLGDGSLALVLAPDKFDMVMPEQRDNSEEDDNPVQHEDIYLVQHVSTVPTILQDALPLISACSYMRLSFDPGGVKIGIHFGFWKALFSLLQVVVIIAQEGVEFPLCEHCHGAHVPAYTILDVMLSKHSSVSGVVTVFEPRLLMDLNFLAPCGSGAIVEVRQQGYFILNALCQMQAPSAIHRLRICIEALVVHKLTVATSSLKMRSKLSMPTSIFASICCIIVLHTMSTCSPLHITECACLLASSIQPGTPLLLGYVEVLYQFQNLSSTYAVVVQFGNTECLELSAQVQPRGTFYAECYIAGITVSNMLYNKASLTGSGSTTLTGNHAIDSCCEIAYKLACETFMFRWFRAGYAFLHSSEHFQWAIAWVLECLELVQWEIAWFFRQGTLQPELMLCTSGKKNHAKVCWAMTWNSRGLASVTTLEGTLQNLEFFQWEIAWWLSLGNSVCAFNHTHSLSTKACILLLGPGSLYVSHHFQWQIAWFLGLGCPDSENNYQHPFPTAAVSTVPGSVSYYFKLAALENLCSLMDLTTLEIIPFVWDPGDFATGAVQFSCCIRVQAVMVSVTSAVVLSKYKWKIAYSSEILELVSDSSLQALALYFSASYHVRYGFELLQWMIAWWFSYECSIVLVPLGATACTIHHLRPACAITRIAVRFSCSRYHTQEVASDMRSRWFAMVLA